MMPIFRTALLCIALGSLTSVSAAAGDCTATPAAEVLGSITTAMQNSAAMADTRIELEPMNGLPPTGISTLAIKGAWPSSRVALQLGWSDCHGGRPQGALYWFKARAWHEAWVYGSNTAAGLAISAAAPERKTVDLAALQVRSSELANAFDDLVTSHTVHAASPVLKADLAPAPLVHRNDVVAVVVAANGVQVRTRGTALDSGAAGAVVPVLIDGAGSSIRARVTAQGETYAQ